MIKKSITYKDFNDNEVTETLRFNLTKTEMIDLLSIEDQLKALSAKFSEPKRDLQREEILEILSVVKDLARRSYGVLSTDGKHFRKSDEIWDDFVSSGAYDAFLWAMFSNPADAMAFMSGILPSDIAEEARKQVERPKVPLSELQQG